jgi:hypothetical protein
MKLKDCGCGGSPQVIYTFNQKLKFTVSCPVCENTTPPFDKLMEAAGMWNDFCWKLENCSAE